MNTPEKERKSSQTPRSTRNYMRKSTGGRVSFENIITPKITNSPKMSSPPSRIAVDEDETDILYLDQILQSVLSLFIPEAKSQQEIFEQIKQYRYSLSKDLYQLEILNKIKSSCKQQIVHISQTLTPIITFQSYIRTWNITQNMSLLLPRTSDHWNSLVSSQKTYGHQLFFMSKEYFPPIVQYLENLQLPEQRDQLKNIMKCFDNLLVDALQLKSSLEIINNRQPLVFGVGFVFLNLTEKDLISFTEYMQNLKGTYDFLRRLLTNYVNVANFLINVQKSSPFPFLSLSDLVRVPAIQLSKYQSCLSGMAVDLFNYMTFLSRRKSKRIRRTQQEKKQLLELGHAMSDASLPNTKRVSFIQKAKDDSTIDERTTSHILLSNEALSVSEQTPTKGKTRRIESSGGNTHQVASSHKKSPSFDSATSTDNGGVHHHIIQINKKAPFDSCATDTDSSGIQQQQINPLQKKPLLDSSTELTDSESFQGSKTFQAIFSDHSESLSITITQSHETATNTSTNTNTNNNTNNMTTITNNGNINTSTSTSTISSINTTVSMQGEGLELTPIKPAESPTKKNPSSEEGTVATPVRNSLMNDEEITRRKSSGPSVGRSLKGGGGGQERTRKSSESVEIKIEGISSHITVDERKNSNKRKKNAESKRSGKSVPIYQSLKTNTDPHLWSEMKNVWMAHKAIAKKHKSLRDIVAGKIVLDTFKDQFEGEHKEILMEWPFSPLISEGVSFLKKKEKKTPLHVFLFGDFMLTTRVDLKARLKPAHLLPRKLLHIESEKKDKNKDVIMKMVALGKEVVEFELLCDSSFYDIFSKWIADINPNRVFGIELGEIVKRTVPGYPKGIPPIVVHTSQWIKENGIIEGIFRKSGSTKDIDILKAKYDEGQMDYKSPIDPKTDPSTIAALLKLFYRQLPTPLIPPTQYQRMLDINTDGEDSLAQIKAILNTLPKVNYMSLHYLCKFLEELSTFSSVTKMDISNLSIVFASNIIRAKLETHEDSLRFGRVNNLMTQMITHVNSLFFEESDPMLEDPEWFKELKECAVSSQTTVPDQTITLLSKGGPFGLTKKESAIDMLNFIDQQKQEHISSTSTTPGGGGSSGGGGGGGGSSSSSSVASSPKKEPPSQPPPPTQQLILQLPPKRESTTPIPPSPKKTDI